MLLLREGVYPYEYIDDWDLGYFLEIDVQYLEIT